MCNIFNKITEKLATAVYIIENESESLLSKNIRLRKFEFFLPRKKKNLNRIKERSFVVDERL